MAQPLMPHATASWLVDNTSLSFEQIAEFCGLHILEIQAIADDTAATKLTGRDPVRAHEITQEEIGALSGMSRQNANRALNRLEKEGLLRLEYGGVTILDVERLRGYGD